MKENPSEFESLTPILQAPENQHSKMVIEALIYSRKIFRESQPTKLGFLSEKDPKYFTVLLASQPSFELIKEVMLILIEFTSQSLQAKVIFEEKINYQHISEAICLAEIKNNVEVTAILDLILCLVVGGAEYYKDISEGTMNSPIFKQIWNPNPISKLFFGFLSTVNEELQLKFLKKFSNLVNSSLFNRFETSKSRTIEAIIQNYNHILLSTSPKDSTFQGIIFDLLKSLVPLHHNSMEMKALFQLFDYTGKTPPSIKILEFILYCVQKSRSPDYFHFNQSQGQFGYIQLNGISAFPPFGYTFSTWIKILDWEPTDYIDIINFITSGDNSQFSISLTSEKKVQLSASKTTEFPTFSMKEGQWYHLVLAHSKGRLSSPPSLTLYIDGIEVETIKEPYPNPSTTPLSVWIGNHSNNCKINKMSWNLGPTHFFEEAIDAARVNAMYNIGPRIDHNFQGSLSSFYTHETVDGVNLEKFGRINETFQTSKQDHFIFSVQNISVSEDKIMFSFHPSNVFSDAKSKPINQRENPIRNYVWNSAHIKRDFSQVNHFGEIYGLLPAFVHRDFSETLLQVGGIPVLFKLIELCHVITFFLFLVSFPFLFFFIHNNF